MRVLLDTHAWVWALWGVSELSDAARSAIERADEAYVSAVSIYEIAQKIRRDAWPGMSTDRLDEMINEPVLDARIMPVSHPIMRSAGLLAWSNRDPFDRMIAATALADDLVLVTKDKAFKTVDGVSTLW